MSFLSELQRRNVGRVATAYVVSAWLVIQVIETIFPAFGFSDRAFQVLVIVLVVGFVPTVVIAWLFEWTPEGLKRDADAELSVDEKLVRARKFDRGIIVVLLLAVSYFAVDKFVFTELPVDDGFYGARSIAVMPFEIRSSDPEQQHFADGVTDEIRHLLGTIRDLRVIAEYSSSVLGDGDFDMSKVWDELRIGHVLEGSVRRDGDRVRISASLIDARAGTQLWTDVYERELGDVFLIQDDIARNVLFNLKIELQESHQNSRNVNPEARALVMEANRIFQERPSDFYEQILPLSQRAYELDPDYPEAVKSLIRSTWMNALYGAMPMDEARTRTAELGERYRELAPDSGYLEAGRGWTAEATGELETAAAQYLLALDKDLTDSEHLRWAGRLAITLGRHDVAVGILEHALAIDPLNHQVRRILSQALMHRRGPGDLRRALEVREQYLASAAAGGEPYYAQLLLLTGSPEEVANVWSETLTDFNPNRTSYIAMADFSMGRTDEAMAGLHSLEEKAAEIAADGSTQLSEWQLRYAAACVAAWMGDADRAFANLLHAPIRPTFLKLNEVFSPQWDKIVEDPRWVEYRDAIGMSQERLDAIEFDPWLPE